MQTYRTAAVLLGGIFLGPTPTATGQTTDLASATVPTSEYVVFLDNGTNRLSSAAIDTIRIAAGAARSATIIRVAGRADYAEAVKNELVRDGVLSGSVIVGREPGSSLPTVADGIAEPLSRRVEITF